MPEYIYKARNEEGKEITGRMWAEDEQQLHQRLSRNSLYLIKARASGSGKLKARKLRTGTLAEFCRQLGTFSGAGVPLVKALKIVGGQESHSAYEKRIYGEVLRLVRQGTTLSDAMEEQGAAFPPLVIHMIRSAETGGNLADTAVRLAAMLDKQDRMQARIKASTVYPRILCALLLAVTVFMLIYILPQFESLFSQMDTLPLSTRLLFGMSNAVKRHWKAALVLSAAAFPGLYFLFCLQGARLFVDKGKLRIPFYGKRMKVIYSARFARTVSSLYAAGIPIAQALQISGKTVGNLYLEKQLVKLIVKVRAGESLSDSLEEVDGFVKKLGAAVRVGEETGSLDIMLDACADSLEYEAGTASEKMVASLEPVLVIIMGMIVGFIMLSVMLPIFHSYETMGNIPY